MVSWYAIGVEPVLAPNDLDLYCSLLVVKEQEPEGRHPVQISAFLYKNCGREGEMGLKSAENFAVRYVTPSQENT